MPIVIEDGSGVENANSYASGADIRAYAGSAGISLPGSNDDALLPLISQAMLYLEDMEPRFQGRPVYQSQPLAWPRSHVWVRGTLLDEDAVPQRVIDAECQLIIEIANGTILLPTVLPQAQGGGFVTMEKTDVLQTNYSEKLGNLGDKPVVYAVEALLRPFFNTNTGVSLVRG